jgi:hypothetical protein
MRQSWPEDDVTSKLFAMYKQQTDAGYIEYLYGGGERVSSEALAKAVMSLMESRIALAVDVVNGVIFASAAIFAYAVNSGTEEMFTGMGFRAMFDLLKSQGLPARVIEIRKNGSIKYLD